MSPFEAITHKLGQALGRLSRRAQVAVLVCAARALMPQYLEWVVRSGVDDNTRVLNDALDSAANFAVGAAAPAAEGMLAYVEAVTPAEPSDVPGFTAAQDCWICADSALRVSQGAFSVEDAAWYALEPIFQATSERLFGVSDAGSRDQVRAESEALADSAVVSAVRAIEEAVDLLTERPSPDAGDLEQIMGVLRVLKP